MRCWQIWAGYLEQLRHHLSMLCCEAHVDAGGELQGIQVPAPLRHEVVDLVDVQLLGGRLDGHQAHVRLAYHLQTINLLHRLSKMLRCLCEYCHMSAEVHSTSELRNICSQQAHLYVWSNVCSLHWLTKKS